MSEDTLEELGIKADDTLQVTFRFKITLLEFNGAMRAVAVTGKFRGGES
jgi:hypothetical protein